MMKILNVVGARPNFIKVAPLYSAFRQYPDMLPLIVHTGQHHDFLMSGIFFEQLGIPEPRHFLGVGSGSSTSQTAEIMCAFEKVVRKEKPELIVVVGDVTSTLACALVAVQMRVPLAHVEAGLRSRDRAMPEEINRILTDAVADELFVTEQAAVDNLLRENIDLRRIHFVGNVMIDSLVQICNQMGNLPLPEDLQIVSGQYVLVTMHRPANVDHEPGLRRLSETLKMLGQRYRVIFISHPRTTASINRFGLNADFEMSGNLNGLAPQGYVQFLNLLRNASVVVTDSGGVQEETTFLKVPCITLRDNTERPVTVECGTNHLLPDFDGRKVCDLIELISVSGGKAGRTPALWDGHTAPRIVNILREKYINS